MNSIAKCRQYRNYQNYEFVKTIAGIIIAAVLLLYLVQVSFESNSVQGSMYVEDKAYIVIQIEKDDSLWSIASTYMNRDYYDHESYIKEVINMNHLKDTTIQAGEQILIPIIKSQDSTVTLVE
ncbi:LysM peptidoglycan-binding domain-containing protein [Petrocella sp. FN5]|uniref:LysM peptidoglycan-binding domain-containing protein n=1 Tax=Petrocella sp. FN5 TaxID=3032002 RepID=UPI0023D9EBC0|nr:LysM peptidoglycan-binding domain-containing protein [Petrocella sp. FN5]MDF1617964.1 LysM peptidoglycan-binding domain-containing protein [Petrocella sp. FN5]